MTFAQTLPIDKSSDPAFQSAVKKYFEEFEANSENGKPVADACYKACPDWVGSIEVRAEVDWKFSEGTCTCTCLDKVGKDTPPVPVFADVTCPALGSPLSSEMSGLTCSAESAVDEMKKKDRY